MTTDTQYEVIYVVLSPGGVVRWTRSSGLRHDAREDAQVEVDRLIADEPRLLSASIVVITVNTEKHEVFLRAGD